MTYIDISICNLPHSDQTPLWTFPLSCSGTEENVFKCTSMFMSLLLDIHHNFFHQKVNAENNELE